MNYYSNTPKFMVSLLKSFYGDAATKDNGFGFDYLPKPGQDCSWTHIWEDMYNGKIKGMMAFGMNGVMIGPDTNKNINALKKADWLVVGEIYPDETSEFWRAPGITADEQKTINTTVYRLPCAGFAEKDGSMTNSARWVTWKYAAVPPPGQARLDQDIVAQIFLRVRDLYKKEGGKFPDPILNLSWAYADAAHPPLSQVAMEINGKALADLKDDVTGQVIKAGQQLPGICMAERTTALRRAAIGFIPVRGRRPVRKSSGEARRIPPGWAFIPTTRGRGRPTGACFTIAHPAIQMESRGTPSASRSGGAKGRESGWATMCRTSSPTSNPKDHLGPFIMNPEGVGRLFAPIGVLAGRAVS